MALKKSENVKFGNRDIGFFADYWKIVFISINTQKEEVVLVVGLYENRTAGAVKENKPLRQELFELKGDEALEIINAKNLKSASYVNLKIRALFDGATDILE